MVVGGGRTSLINIYIFFRLKKKVDVLCYKLF